MGTDGEKKKVPGIDMEKGTISFDYIKGNNFRVIHVDGGIGGSAPPPGIVHLNVFNERWPIPKRTVMKIGPKGEVGGEILEEQVTRDAVIREVEALLVMDIAVATRVRDWLTRNIEKIQKATKAKPERRTK